MKSIFLSLLLILVDCNNTPIIAQKNNEKQIYVCGPCGGSCDELSFTQPGKCPHCNMPLVEKSKIQTTQPNPQKQLTICFYLQNNIELLDFAGPMEVFTAAGFNVFTVSKTKDAITSLGLKLMPDYSIQNAPPADVMVFFGGAHGAPSNDTELIAWIKSRKPNTQYFMSVCTGAFIMGKAGILDDLTATTYHTQIDALQNALPKTKVLPNVRFVDNGNVITTAGISAGIDGALHFVSKIKGLDFAKQVANDIEYDKWIPNQGLIISKP